MPTAASAVISVSPAQTAHYGSPHPPATTIAPALAANHPTVQPIARARLQELNVKTRLPAAPTPKKISAQVTRLQTARRSTPPLPTEYSSWLGTSLLAPPLPTDPLSPKKNPPRHR